MIIAKVHPHWDPHATSGCWGWKAELGYVLKCLWRSAYIASAITQRRIDRKVVCLGSAQEYDAFHS
jgi:hypothetical protein